MAEPTPDLLAQVGDLVMELSGSGMQIKEARPDARIMGTGIVLGREGFVVFQLVDPTDRIPLLRQAITRYHGDAFAVLFDGTYKDERGYLHDALLVVSAVRGHPPQGVAHPYTISSDRRVTFGGAIPMQGLHTYRAVFETRPTE